MSRAPIPQNPYIAGRALGALRGFFGRQDVFELVQSTMSSPDNNALVLFGQRRIGKTSILLQLQRRLPSPPFIPIYFDLMDRAQHPLGVLLSNLAGTIGAAVDMPPETPAAYDNEGVFFRTDFLPRLQTVLDGRRPILLLDEFDVFDVRDDRELPEAAAARSFFPYLRQLMETQPWLAFVFVLGRKTEEMSIDVKATFKTARYKYVSVLARDDAKDLVLTAQRDETLRFEDAAVEEILAVTAGHPYFTQLLCQILWDAAHVDREYDGAPVISPDAVTQAVSKALEAGQNVFEWIWDGLPPAERVIFAAIAENSAPDEVVSEAQLVELLQQRGIRILTREIELAPQLLVEWGMLRKTATGYGFFIEIMRQWVALRKPLARVKDELDRIEPLAETLYRSGDGFYRQRDLARARELLRQALAVNPNHLKARLLLGQVLLERQETEQSVRELEEAYQRDEDAARYALVRGLLLRGEDLEQTGRLDEAEKVYQRALAVSPSDAVPPQRLRALQVARAERAEAEGRLEAALTLYQQLDPVEHAKAIQALEVRLESRALHTQAENALHHGNYEEALRLYRQLVQLAPDNQEWINKVAAIETEVRVQDLYREGAAAADRGDWTKALASLAPVVELRPDFRDARALLGKAGLHISDAHLTGRAQAVWWATWLFGSVVAVLLGELAALGLGTVEIVSGYGGPRILPVYGGGGRGIVSVDGGPIDRFVLAAIVGLVLGYFQWSLRKRATRGWWILLVAAGWGVLGLFGLWPGLLNPYGSFDPTFGWLTAVILTLLALIVPQALYLQRRIPSTLFMGAAAVMTLILAFASLTEFGATVLLCVLAQAGFAAAQLMPVRFSRHDVKTLRVPLAELTFTEEQSSWRLWVIWLLGSIGAACIAALLAVGGLFVINPRGADYFWFFVIGTWVGCGIGGAQWAMLKREMRWRWIVLVALLYGVFVGLMFVSLNDWPHDDAALVLAAWPLAVSLTQYVYLNRSRPSLIFVLLGGAAGFGLWLYWVVTYQINDVFAILSSLALLVPTQAGFALYAILRQRAKSIAVHDGGASADAGNYRIADNVKRPS